MPDPRDTITRTYAGALIVTLGLLTGCGGGADPSDDAALEEGASAVTAEDGGPSGSKRVPERSFATLDGAEMGLPDLAGNVVVVNFWGTWCLPCRTELPELVELAHAYADQPVEVVGIAIESGEPEEIAEFLTEYGVDYDIWIAGMDVAVADFGAVGFPFTLVVDSEGWIRKELLGPQTLESLATEIDLLLAE